MFDRAQCGNTWHIEQHKYQHCHGAQRCEMFTQGKAQGGIFGFFFFVHQIYTGDDIQ